MAETSRASRIFEGILASAIGGVMTVAILATVKKLWGLDVGWLWIILAYLGALAGGAVLYFRGRSKPTDSYEGLLSPLQLDALRLAKRMREFHEEIKPNWSMNQVMHGYAHQFNKDLMDVRHRLGMANIGTGLLERYTQAITDPSLIVEGAKQLERLALQLNDVAVS